MAPKMERTRYPGIYKRGGRYVVVWEHRGRQHKSFHRTVREAREAKAQRDSGDKRPPSRVRVEDYFSEWIESYAGRTQRGFSETTRAEYRRPIEAHALSRWGRWRLAEVEPADVRELFGQMRKSGASTAGIKKLRAALSAMFATAVDDGLVQSNPVSGVRVPAGPNDQPHERRAKALTRVELNALLRAFPDSWRLFFEFLVHTGLRISEAVALNWEHLDLGERPRVRVREQLYQGTRKRLKSSNGRRDIPLSPGMKMDLLARRRDAYRGPKSPVFSSRVDTALIPSNVYGRVLAPTAKSLGLVAEVEGKDEPISAVSFHTFRHTCASLLFDAGRNIKQVQEWLGHADPGFTLRTYVHLMDEGIGDAAFMDDVVQVGKGWARQHPQTTEEAIAAGSPETAD
jgi:integrase